jgi:hypothetical protein
MHHIPGRAERDPNPKQTDLLWVPDAATRDSAKVELLSLDTRNIFLYATPVPAHLGRRPVGSGRCGRGAAPAAWD